MDEVNEVQCTARPSLYRMGLFQVKPSTPRYPPKRFDQDGFLIGDLDVREHSALARWPEPLKYQDLDKLDNPGGRRRSGR